MNIDSQIKLHKSLGSQEVKINGTPLKLIAAIGIIILLSSCANLGIRVLPNHFVQFELHEPASSNLINATSESCSATAEGSGAIPAGYRRIPTAITNCTDHAPETLLNYSIWDGIDTSAQPGYDASRTCWRLHGRFRSAAARLSALAPLFSDGTNIATIRQTVIEHMGEAAALYYWNDGGNFNDAPINGLTLAHAHAMADLAVTGRNAYSAFLQTRPIAEDEGDAVYRKVRLDQVADLIRAQNPSHSIDAASIERSIKTALDRAYTSLWAIRGPIAERARLRSAQGYIAVAADEDPPHRPVNVFSPDISRAPTGSGLPGLMVYQQNATIGVPIQRRDWSLPRNDRNWGVPIESWKRVTLRYLLIVDGAEGLATRSGVNTTMGERDIPSHDPLVIPDDYDVVLMLHGHSSRAEEAMDLARPLIQEWKTKGNRKLAVLAVDLPSNGYSEMIDHQLIGDIEADGSARVSEFNWHDGSFTAYYPTLDFIENSVTRFVSQLSLVDYPQLKSQIKAVVGGSLGGNLGLRLSKHDKDINTGKPYLRNIVSWSPASTWGDSWARARICSPLLFDCFNLAESGTYSDLAKHEAVRATRDKYREYDEGLRSADGRSERGNRKLEYFVGVFTTSGTIFETILENEFPPQGDRWYRDGWPCKKTYLKGAIFDRWEIYNKLYRLWHWRVAHEQLIFMHNEPYATNRSVRGTFGGARSYEQFGAHLLLAAGNEDNHPPDRLYDNTRELARSAYDFHRPRSLPKLTGHTLWMENTGHSIHNERPNFLAAQIWDFLSLSVRE